jgi:hypothetical protein
MSTRTPHEHVPAVYIRSERGRCSGLTFHHYRCRCGEELSRLTNPTVLGLSA